MALARSLGAETRPLSRVTWTLEPAHPPAVWRPCPRCGQARRFRSSGRFRLNAQRKRLDAWLIYRCEVCAATWNREVHARVTPQQLGAERVRRLEANDPTEARVVAFDVAPLRRQGMRIDDDAAVAVRRWPAGPDVVTGPAEIVLRLAGPVRLRLDRLLAEQLGLSRSAVQALARRGGLVVEPGGRRALRRPVADGMRIRLP